MPFGSCCLVQVHYLLCFFFGGRGGGIFPSSMEVLLLVIKALLAPSTSSPSGADMALNGTNDICWMHPVENECDGFSSTSKIVSSSPSRS